MHVHLSYKYNNNLYANILVFQLFNKKATNLKIISLKTLNHVAFTKIN